MPKDISTPVRISRQEHRENQIQARKAFTETVQIFCAATRKAIRKSAHGAPYV